MRPHPRCCRRLRCTLVCTHVATESWTPGQASPTAVPCLCLVAAAARAQVSRLAAHTGGVGSREALTCPGPGGAACTRGPELRPACPAQGQAGTRRRGAQGRAEAAGPVSAAARARSPQASAQPGSARPPAPRPGARARPPARPPGSRAGSAEPPRRPARAASLNCSPLGRRRLRRRRVPAPSHAEAASHRPGGAGGAGPGAQAAGPAPQLEREPHRERRRRRGRGAAWRRRRQQRRLSLRGPRRRAGLRASGLWRCSEGGGREEGAGTLASGARAAAPAGTPPSPPASPAAGAADPGLTEPAGGPQSSLRPPGAQGLLEAGTPIIPSPKSASCRDPQPTQQS